MTEIQRRQSTATASSSTGSSASPSPPSMSSSPSSPASASSLDHGEEEEEPLSSQDIKAGLATDNGAAAAAPLVSILRNPKAGSKAVSAGELTRPTVAIPEVEASANGTAARIAASVSPSATFSAIKNAFAGVGGGKRRSSSTGSGKGGAPLGNSFKREGPPPLDEKGRIQGAPLLDVDPRETPAGEGEEELAGSFVSEQSSSSSSSTSASQAAAAALNSSTSTSGSSSNGFSRGRQPSRSSVSSPGRPNKQGLMRSTSTASTASQTSTQSSDTRSSSSHAIRFCPLPKTGRLKRANSITIGIAARSQMLLSQGSGPVPRAHSNQAWQAYQPPAALLHAAQGSSTHGAAHTPAHAHTGVHPTDPRYAGFQPNRAAAAWYEAGGELPPDVVDVGAELKKVGRYAWRKMKGEGKKGEAAAATESGSGAEGTTKASGSGSALPTIDATDDDNDAEADGMKTPRASSSQHGAQVLLSMSSMPNSSAIPGPGTSPGTSTSTSKAHMHRRVSTGTFLGNQSSLREMQSRRHADLVGEDGGEEAVDLGTAEGQVPSPGWGLGAEDKQGGNLLPRREQNLNGDSAANKKEGASSLLGSLIARLFPSSDSSDLSSADGPLPTRAAAAADEDEARHSHGDGDAGTKTPRKDTWDEEQRALAEAKIREQLREEAEKERREIEGGLAAS